jgi:hypothetical protein
VWALARQASPAGFDPLVLYQRLVLLSNRIHGMAYKDLVATAIALRTQQRLSLSEIKRIVPVGKSTQLMAAGLPSNTHGDSV